MSSRRKRVQVIVLGVLLAAAGGVVYYVSPSSTPPVATAKTQRDPTAHLVDGPAPATRASRRQQQTAVGAAKRVDVAVIEQKNVALPALEVKRKASERPAEPGGVRVAADFEGTAPLEAKQLSDSRFSLRLTSPGLRNWFMLRVENVPASGITVRLDLDGISTQKWGSLNPLYSYCNDLSDLAAYGSKAQPAVLAAARNGAQIPDTAAAGQQWHYLTEVWTDYGERLSVVHHFERDAYVAMRIPYLPAYHDAFLRSLANEPNVSVIRLGESGSGRPLVLAKISASEQSEREKPCILIYAREHANEQDGSWAVQGAIQFLISGAPDAARLRERANFLFIPLLDPDGAAAGSYERITYSFKRNNPSAEALAYGGWFTQWLDAGKRLDIVLNLHNVESSEFAHLCCFFAEPGRLGVSQDLHAAISRRITAADGIYRVDPKFGQGYTTNRLGGWLGYYYGPLPMLYELNSQEKHRHLTLAELRDMGRRLVLGCTDFLDSPQAAPALATIDYLRRQQEQVPRDNVPPNPFAAAAASRWTSLRAVEELAKKKTN